MANALDQDACSLACTLCLLFPFLLTKAYKALFVGITIILAHFSFLSQHIQLPPLPEKGIKGQAHIRITNISPTSSHFSSGLLYRGRILSFLPEASTPLSFPIKNIPFTLYLPNKSRVSSDHQEFRVYATLKKTPHKTSCLLKVSNQSSFIPCLSWKNLSQLRLESKEKVKKFIQKNIVDAKAADFLSGISTGEFEDRCILFNFNRLGLAHIMAISGFHFSIVSSFLCFFFHLLLPPRFTSYLLISLLSFYFLFLGWGPSILRAWVAQASFLLAFLFRRKSDSLNNLGLALILCLTCDPFYYESLGFHLSFLATASILLFYEPLDTAFQIIYPKKTLAQALESNWRETLPYLWHSTLRKALALLTSVHLSTIAATLYFFHKFPLMSLLYNLFFPFLVSLSLILLLTSSLIGFALPVVGKYLHLFNSHYTKFVLDFSFHMPVSLDVAWRTHSFPKAFFLLYLIGIFITGIYFHFSMKTAKLP